MSEEINEITPEVKIEKSAGNIRYYMVTGWHSNYSTEWTEMYFGTDRKEAERRIGDWTKEELKYNPDARQKYLLVSFDLPAQP